MLSVIEKQHAIKPSNGLIDKMIDNSAATVSFTVCDSSILLVEVALSVIS